MTFARACANFADSCGILAKLQYRETRAQIEGFVAGLTEAHHLITAPEVSDDGPTDQEDSIHPATG